jgi:hypothetical protein
MKPTIIKTTLKLLGCFVAAMLATPAFAVKMENEVTVTPAYVRDHPKEFSVDVTKGNDGLIHFIVKHDVAMPMYHVAHFAISHQGRLVAESFTPLFGKKQGNTFHFSISAEDIAGAKFALSDSAVAGSGDDAVPLGGTTIHQFRLLDFVPKELLSSAPIK